MLTFETDDESYADDYNDSNHDFESLVHNDSRVRHTHNYDSLLDIRNRD